MEKKRKIRDEIRTFRRIRPYIAIPLLVIGVIGLVFPVIPGLALIFVGVMLLLPRTGDKLVRTIKSKL